MKDLINQQNNPAGWDQAQNPQPQEEMNPFFWEPWSSQKNNPQINSDFNFAKSVMHVRKKYEEEMISNCIFFLKKSREEKNGEKGECQRA